MAKLPLKTFKAKTRRRLVAKAREDAFFIGRALTVYQRLRDMDDQQLAQWLACSEPDLNRLALCRLPDDQQDRFQQDVRKVATFAACNPDRLIQLLREVSSWDTLQGGDRKLAAGLLLAARDHKPDREDDTSGGQE
jgi:hypothetical protein